jgi:hypothetical protein
LDGLSILIIKHFACLRSETTVEVTIKFWFIHYDESITFSEQFLSKNWFFNWISSKSIRNIIVN